MRRKLFSLRSAAALFAGSLLLATPGSRGHAQEPPAKPAASQPKTAAQQFKNIQVLKDIPAEQLIPSMQFISASLGQNCEFCHVENAKDKDDKKTKLMARKMIAMVLAIDKANFDEKLTDMTCLPDNLSGRTWYKPTDQGFEQRLRARLEEIRKVKSRSASNP